MFYQAYTTAMAGPMGQYKDILLEASLWMAVHLEAFLLQAFFLQAALWEALLQRALLRQAFLGRA
jgi:hypothetical protein